MDKLSRRQALAGLGTVSLASLLAACGDDTGSPGAADVTTETGTTATVQTRTTGADGAAGLLDDSSACTLTAEQTEGPYYFDVDAIRSDLREDRKGTPLRLAIRVRDAERCEPIPGAVVDIWHCDAEGIYSGFESASMGGPGGGRSDDETYLRGAQATGDDGIARFTTIYPGWYRGRTTHIHAKVHLDRETVLTTQLYFDEEVSARVYEREPYAADSGRDAFNDGDGIFDEALVMRAADDGDDVLAAISFDVRRA